MGVFQELQAGVAYDIRDPRYLEEVHAEIARSEGICWEVAQTNPLERGRILELEGELFGGLEEGTFVTPSFRIDCASQVHLGRNVFFNHSLTMMSLGGITVEDGVMVGPGAGFFTVNHEPGNIRTVMTKGILVKRDAWIGARASILPGVTVGEGAIVGTGAVVTKDVPDGAVVAGVPAKVIRTSGRGESA
ncbi:MAG: DapH/DapD/GlmU-related protein [Atopobiaceae bacterium]|jgi:acetyltransferase-like isoleucine patch superfamily enzyme|nr:hypothetical protein [Atopobiaceae bacterium]